MEAPPPAEAGDDLMNEDDVPRGSGANPEFQEVLTDQERLTRLRKRGKKILLVIADELERISLMAMMHQDGYRSLFEAKSLIEALEHHRRVPLDLLVLDQVVGHLGAMKLVELLREKGLPSNGPVIVVQKSVDHQLTLALKGGRVNLLVQRPVDFAGTMKAAMETMLGL